MREVESLDEVTQSRELSDVYEELGENQGMGDCDMTVESRNGGGMKGP